jgi:hypothetical protein
MALSTAAKVMNDVTVVIADNTGTPISATIAGLKAALPWSDVAQGLAERVDIEVRGSHHTSRHTTRKYPKLTLGQLANDFSNATAGVVTDAGLKLGAWGAGVSFLGANAEVFAVKITVTWEGTSHGDSADHVAIFEKCVMDSMGTEDSDDGSMTTSTWTVLGNVTLDGNAMTAP